MAEETFYCSFVGNHYIICECGDNFPSEDALRVHLENNHDKVKTEPKTVPEWEKVVQLVKPVKTITLKKVPQQKPQQKKVIFIQAVNVKRNTDHRTSYVFNLPESEKFPNIKQEEKAIVVKEEERHPVIYAAQPASPQIKEETHICEDELKQDTYEQNPSPPMLDYMVETQYNDESQDVIDCQEELVYIDNEEIVQDDCHASTDPQVQEAVRNLLQQHLTGEQQYDTTTVFCCNVCGKEFPTQKSVSMHKSRVHVYKPNYSELTVNNQAKPVKNNKKVVCEVCGKRYASNAALRYHQRVHTGERPHECPFCPKTFTMPLFLQIHVRTHTGERPYHCPSCPKAFGNKAALLRHDRVHTGVKPYACPKCQKTFTQSNSMKLHVKTVHLKQPAPYKSKARKMKQLLKLQAQGQLDEEQEKQLYESIATTVFVEQNYDGSEVKIIENNHVKEEP